MSVKERLLAIISEFTDVPADSIDTSLSFKLSVQIDSFGLLTMMNTIEDEFGIEIPEASLKKFRTIDDIISYIEQALPDQS
jgi:acyl carrier protein